MVSVVSLALLGVVFVVHTLIAAVMTRFFRLRMNTQWGAILYALVLIPLVLLVTLLVFTGVLGIGVDVGNSVVAIVLLIAMPLALGYTIDVLYMPSPEEYELPDTQ